MAQRQAQPSNPPPSYSPPFAGTPTRSLCPKCHGYIDIPQGDPENDPNEPSPGWPKIAKLITDTPGLESFQSFRDLNIKSLLYYQARLVDLRDQLHEQEWKDSKSHPQVGDQDLDFGMRVDHLLLCKGQPNEEIRAQLDLITEIQLVLKEYSTFPSMV
jgi:hypothetical protein